MSLLARLGRREVTPGDTVERSSMSWNAYLNLVQNLGAPFTQPADPTREPISRTTVGYAKRGMAGNSIVYTCAQLRVSVFSDVFFQWRDDRTRNVFGTDALEPLEAPWPGGSTRDLLARMEVDVTTAGQSYWVNAGSLVRSDRVNLLRLQPEYVTIVLERVEVDGATLGMYPMAYVYQEPNGDPVVLDVSEVAHYAPIPDPTAQFRGMSWLTPVLTEVELDDTLNEYKQTHLDNQATPNLALTFPESTNATKFRELVEVVKSTHSGARNAGKTLMLGGGADVKVIGANFEQLAMKATQGALETRIAAAAGVPPVMAGISEGLQGSSLNAGNYGQARRRFADATMRPLWGSAAEALSVLLPAPSGARLVVEDRFTSFLQEDVKDEAEIRGQHAMTIRQLVDAGYAPDAAVTAAIDGNFAALRGQHSGLFSVQLQEPGTGSTATP